MALFIAFWKIIPQKVPTHFDALGNPNSWGSKGSLLMLPIDELVLFILINVVSKFPQHFNYIVDITAENAERQYQNARTLLSCLLAEFTIIFSYLEYQSIQIAMNTSKNLNVWFLPFSLITLFGTLGIFIYRMYKLK